MVTKLFLQWNEENRKKLDKMGITIDQIIENDEPTDNDGVAVDYLSEICLGRVSVWESGDVDMEILNISSEEVLLYKHYDSLMIVDFNKLLQEFFDVMQHDTGL